MRITEREIRRDNNFDVTQTQTHRERGNAAVNKASDCKVSSEDFSSWAIPHTFELFIKDVTIKNTLSFLVGVSWCPRHETARWTNR